MMKMLKTLFLLTLTGLGLSLTSCVTTQSGSSCCGKKDSSCCAAKPACPSDCTKPCCK